MLQQETPEDYVIATGEQHSVREFIELAAAELGMAIRWEGDGVEEKGFDGSGRQIVCVDKRYFRPTEVESLLGDATKAKTKLGWAPKISFRELVSEMVEADLNEAQRQIYLNRGGF
jgi:GDPmannose 4,6-dehydratase